MVFWVTIWKIGCCRFISGPPCIAHSSLMCTFSYLICHKGSFSFQARLKRANFAAKIMLQSLPFKAKLADCKKQDWSYFIELSLFLFPSRLQCSLSPLSSLSFLLSPDPHYVPLRKERSRNWNFIIFICVSVENTITDPGAVKAITVSVGTRPRISQRPAACWNWRLLRSKLRPVSESPAQIAPTESIFEAVMWIFKATRQGPQWPRRFGLSSHSYLLDPVFEAAIDPFERSWLPQKASDQ